jgi:hypothetical protein
MAGEYSQKWLELRRLRRDMLRLALAGGVILVLTPLTSFFSQTVRTVLGIPIFLAAAFLLIRFLFLLAEHGNWPCPRCRRPFHYAVRWFGKWDNPFADRCAHCGLPKWADVDPQRHREAAPFRRDEGFSMNDSRKAS